MGERSSQTLTTERMSHIRDTDPAVSLNINLAKDLKLEKGDVVEVDYDLLRDTLAAVYAPEDNSELQVRFEANEPEEDESDGQESDDEESSYYLDNDDSGYYEYDDKLAVVGVDKDLHETQNTLEHELQHYADGTNHVVTKQGRLGGLLYAASHGYGEKAAYASSGFFLGLTSANAASYQIDRPSFIPPETYFNALEKMDQAMAPSGLLMLGAIALASVYYLDKGERRARKAEKTIELPPTLTVKRH